MKKLLAHSPKYLPSCFLVVGLALCFAVGCAKADLHVSPVPTSGNAPNRNANAGTVVTHGAPPQPGDYDSTATVFFLKVNNSIAGDGSELAGIGYLPSDADQDSMPFSFAVPPRHDVMMPLVPWRSGVAYLRNVGGSTDSIVWTDSTTLQTLLVTTPSKPVRSLMASSDGKWLGWIDTAGIANVYQSESHQLIALNTAQWPALDLQLAQSDTAGIRGGSQGNQVRFFKLTDPKNPTATLPASDFRLQGSGMSVLLLQRNNGSILSLTQLASTRALSRVSERDSGRDSGGASGGASGRASGRASGGSQQVTIAKGAASYSNLAFVDERSVAYTVVTGSESRVYLATMPQPIDSDLKAGPTATTLVATLKLSAQEVRNQACPSWSNGSLFYSFNTPSGRSILRTRLLDRRWSTETFAQPETLESGFICPVTLPTE